MVRAFANHSSHACLPGYKTRGTNPVARSNEVAVPFTASRRPPIHSGVIRIRKALRRIVNSDAASVAL